MFTKGTPDVFVICYFMFDEWKIIVNVKLNPNYSHWQHYSIVSVNPKATLMRGPALWGIP